MSRFHINSKGEARLCKATKNCPFGSLETEHYDSREAAKEVYEASQNSFPLLGYDWPESSETRKFKTLRGEVTLQLSDAFNSMNTHHKLEAWLTTPEEGNVAFVSLLVRDENYHEEVGEHLAMCDIETRPDQRKKGFALELRQSIEKETGLLIYSSGGYTPEGWEAFGKHGRYLPNPYENDWDKPASKYNSMGFVASWTHMLPLNISREIEYSDEQRDALWEMQERYEQFRRKEIKWAED